MIARAALTLTLALWALPLWAHHGHDEPAAVAWLLLLLIPALAAAGRGDA